MQPEKATITPIAVGINDAAHMIGLSKTRVYELLGKRELVSFLVGGRRLIRVTELERFLASHEAKAAA